MIRPRRAYTKSRTDRAVLGMFGLLTFTLGLAATGRLDADVAQTALWAFNGAILALLGVYQWVGHQDMRAAQPPDPEPCPPEAPR